MANLEEIYSSRFSKQERLVKDRVWSVLCSDFFRQYIDTNDRVLDVAAGFCEFINHVRAAERYAYDLNPAVRPFAGPGVAFVQGSCLNMDALPFSYFDVAFASNFFEHLESKQQMDKVLQEIRRHLKVGGRLIIMQPNIRFLGPRYWDYYDHHLPLTHLSLREALVTNGFRVEKLLPKFMPYTVKSNLPTWPILVRAYLKVRPAWWVLGKQAFVVAVNDPN